MAVVTEGREGGRGRDGGERERRREEGRREGDREGRREEGRREGDREGRREGDREEGDREGRREGDREKGGLGIRHYVYICVKQVCIYSIFTWRERGSAKGEWHSNPSK